MGLLLTELQNYYSEVLKKDLFRETSRILRIPVNLNVYRNTSSIFRKNYHLSYKYLDEYSFQDKTFIYDSKTGFSNSYKKSSSWLKNLKRNNIQEYIGSERYSELHGIKGDKHVNWLDNKQGIFLSDLLNLRTKHETPFTPIQKEIFLNYDYYHPSFTSLYSFYFKKGRAIKNIYDEIEFGKLKFSSSRNVKNMFLSEIPKSDNLCKDAKNYFDKSNLQFSEITEEGYEGICDSISFSNYHPSFPTYSSNRWTTPYVAFRFEELPEQSRKEYYYYSLGDFFLRKGESDNFLNPEDHSNIWFVNYDDIFVLKKTGEEINISLDLKKIPSDFENFLNISTLFNFEFSFKENGIQKFFSFDFKTIVNSQASLKLSKELSLYSDFKVTLKLKDDSKAELMHSPERYIYSLNISDLKKSGFLSKDITVTTEGSVKYFPSQLLDDSILSQFFFITSENNKIPVSEEVLKKLNVRKEFNDEEGIAKIKYYDFFDNLEKEIWFTNLKKLSHLKEKEEFIFETLDQVKQHMNDQFDLNDYFWNSVSFELKKQPQLFDETSEYFLEVKHKNPLIKKQWDAISDIKITVENKDNLSPEVSNDYFSDNEPLSSLFRLRESAKNKNINLSEYKFKTISKQGNNVEIEASLSKSGKTDKRIYSFESIDGTAEAEETSAFSLLSSGNLFENSEKIVWGLGGAILSGGMVSAAFKFLPFVRRKTF